MPAYLEVLGGGIGTVAAYGTLKDLLDSLYQYPGGWLADRIGRARSLMLFTLLSLCGYGLYVAGRTGGLIILGTIPAMAWTSLAQPAIFSVVGDTLPSARRAVGFSMQSIIKRVPIVVAPALGGWMILRLGLSAGMKAGFLLSLLLAAGAIFLIRRFFREEQREHPGRIPITALWRSLDRRLRRLLAADCLIRWAEGIPAVYVVLYVINVRGFNSLAFGTLTGVQMMTSMAVYLPVARLADRGNRTPFIALTFALFAAFPLALVFSATLPAVVLAFVIGGLREIGEPARKAMIVDLAAETTRGRTLGLYYFLRGLAVFPASLIGGLLWVANPRLPFFVAAAIGCAGLVLFTLPLTRADRTETS